MSLLLPELEAFISVVKHSTIHAAAKDIGLTQTGVTQRIRALEKKIGVTLFIRSRKGMTLTIEGKNLLRYCQRVQDIEGETLSLINGLGKEHIIQINIAGSSSIMRSRVIPNTSGILSTYKDLVFDYYITDIDSPLRKLKLGDVDFAVMPTYEVVNELDSKVLEPEIYIMIAPHAWKNRELKDILKNERFVDFNMNDKFTLEYLKKYHLDNFARKEGHHVNNTDALVSMVINEQGYSVLSKKFVEPYIKRKELIDINDGKVAKIGFALAWYPRHEMPKYFKEIIRVIN
ncbi:MAG: LysR family transcriptional regulator [Proteobacteria bacterium]|nr:LysR family transcriptional regulator [Pseudomonadota bacterium]